MTLSTRAAPSNRRLQRPAAIGAVLLLALLAGCGPLLERLAGPRLRLYTHNLHAEETILQPFAANLRAAAPDIAALQEVSQPAADFLRAALADRLPYAAARLDGGRYFGQLVLSRYPVVESQGWPHPRRLLRAVLDVDGRRVTVFNVHPASPGNSQLDTALRDDDIAFALEQAAREAGPTLLLGDFNLEAWSPVRQTITVRYTDLFEAVGRGPAFTYPDYSQPQARVNARFPPLTPPFLRLDYIFASRHFLPLRAQVWPDAGGSDHRPVLAEVALLP